RVPTSTAASASTTTRTARHVRASVYVARTDGPTTASSPGASVRHDPAKPSGHPPSDGVARRTAPPGPVPAPAPAPDAPSSAGAPSPPAPRAAVVPAASAR